jgi:hypothetical protein
MYKGCKAVESASPVSDSSLDSPESKLKSDVSEGRGDEEGMSAGKDLGTCRIEEEEIAGAKLTLVKTSGLKG